MSHLLIGVVGVYTMNVQSTLVSPTIWLVRVRTGPLVIFSSNQTTLALAGHPKKSQLFSTRATSRSDASQIVAKTACTS